jgi:dolichyl-phosphate beta-glucosyltransferase
MNPSLSVVLPAYNELRRLPPYLTAIRAHLDAQQNAYEVIVVDDGSTDHLTEHLRDLSPSWPQLRIIEHSENRGKGAAVRTGMLAGEGQRLLFADADGATPIEEQGRLQAAIEAGADVAIGSRLVNARDVARRRTWSRALVGRAFARVARTTLGLSWRDTQCGFKMFRKTAAHHLFPLVQEAGYLFDLELLALAQRLGYRVVEVPINWSDMPGSQMNMTRDAWGIVKGLWRLRRRQATLGR